MRFLSTEETSSEERSAEERSPEERSPDPSSTDASAPARGDHGSSDDPARETPRDRLLWTVIPVAVALLFGAVLVSDGGAARGDLQIVAPREVEPGRPIPIRAFHFSGARGTAPTAPIAPVTLRPLEGEVTLEEQMLRVGATLGSETQLRAPERAGTYLLETSASSNPDDENAERVLRRVEVRQGASQPARRGRLQSEFQRWELSPMERFGEAPEHLDARVAGGACSPEAPCDLLVWVGSPAASIALVAGDGVQPLSGDECGSVTEESEVPDPTVVSEGVLRCTLRVLGNEATATVLAFRDGALVAKRRVQLPVAAGAPWMDVERAVLALGDTPQLVLGEGLPLPALVLDVFREGRWERSTSGTLEEPPSPLALDAPGLWRVQLRGDPFGVDASATRLLIVADDPVDTLRSHPRQSEWLDPMAAGDAPVCEGVPCSAERLSRFMMAAGELELVTYPSATSGAAQRSAGVHTKQSWRRIAAAVLVMLAGFLVAFVVMRRGLRASREARSLMREAEVEGAEDPARIRRMTWTVVGSALFVVATFGAVAILVISRGCIVGS